MFHCESCADIPGHFLPRRGSEHGVVEAEGKIITWNYWEAWWLDESKNEWVQMDDYQHGDTLVVFGGKLSAIRGRMVMELKGGKRKEMPVACSNPHVASYGSHGLVVIGHKLRDPRQGIVIVQVFDGVKNWYCSPLPHHYGSKRCRAVVFEEQVFIQDVFHPWLKYANISDLVSKLNLM